MVARVREYYLLSDAAEDARRRPAAERDAVAAALALGRQRADAAEALWSNGHAAEGLRLAVDALEQTLDAASVLAADAPVSPAPADPPRATGGDAEPDREDDADPPESDPAGAEERDAAEKDAAEESGDAEGGAEKSAAAESPGDQSAEDTAEDTAPPPTGAWRALLAARLSEERFERLVTALRAAHPPLPALDASVSATHAELYKDLARARVDVDRAVAPAALTPGQIRVRRFSRWAVTALALVLVAVGLYFTLRTPDRVYASASAFYRNDRQFEPENAFDDDPRTEWLLNDRQTGWIEGRLSPPRDLSAIRLLNGHNRHYNDRAVRGYKLEVFDASGEKVHEEEGEFEQLEPSPQWVEHPVDLNDVERIRVTVTSSHRLGGALSEIGWDEK
ncbi:MAG: hypothetical protein CMN29_09815 [Sandaracinus sp.]|nr:hypothetical protein [Sandaracinus sp.]